MELNIWSDGKGSWSYDVLHPLLQRTFPHTQLRYDTDRNADLVVRSHFDKEERAPPTTCPYILWSGEQWPVKLREGDDAPLLEINTAHTGRENEIWMPHLVTEIAHTTRPTDYVWPKRWCAAYAFSNRVRERETMFRQMRLLEPRCYGFGSSCRTADAPFALDRSNRTKNGTAFAEFAYVVAMENAIAPGYITEKIGYAFQNGSIPIYWGDTDTATSLFNAEAFLNVREFASLSAAAEHAVQLWNDPQKLRRYLDAPLTLNRMLEDYEAVRTEYRPWQKPFVDILRDAFPDHS